MCVLSLYHLARFWAVKGGRDQWEKQRMRENHQGGQGKNKKTARWENSASETEGRKERRIMREEESGDGKERKGGSLDVPFPKASADARVLQGWVCRTCVCVPQCLQTVLNKSCSVDGIGWNSPLLFVRWEQSRPVGARLPFIFVSLSIQQLRWLCFLGN